MRHTGSRGGLLAVGVCEDAGVDIGELEVSLFGGVASAAGGGGVVDCISGVR